MAGPVDVLPLLDDLLGEKVGGAGLETRGDNACREGGGLGGAVVPKRQPSEGRDEGPSQRSYLGHQDVLVVLFSLGGGSGANGSGRLACGERRGRASIDSL
jgi:hypothetical protein